ncbi:MAG: hypothetical protein LBR24_02405, partial [Methanobrevibacter sp.]|nr:hypothetical protein [Methanobrevibacter sp.]
MEDFFQELRKIQKKERGNSSLARVGEDFYDEVNKFLDKLKTNIERDPFSEEKHDILNNSKSILTEIFERREHKIADAAVMNIHRSYHLFTGKPQFDLLDTTPLNLTDEEEKLYFALIETLKVHREKISSDSLANNLEEKQFEAPLIDSAPLKPSVDSKPSKSSKSSVDSIPSKSSKPSVDSITSKPSESSTNLSSDDKVLNKLDDIKKAKVIEDEKVESIAEQLNKSVESNSSVEINKSVEKSKSAEGNGADLNNN